MDNNNDIIEINSSEEENVNNENIVTNVLDDEIIISKKKGRKHLSKKMKLILIIASIVLLLIIIGVILYFVIFRKKENNIEDDVKIIEKDNYIYENGTLKLLSKSGTTLGTYNCTVKSADKCYVAKLSNEDNLDIPKYINNKNEQVERTSEIYFNKFVFINDNDKIVLFDIKESKKSGQYSLIKTGNVDNLIAFKDNKGKYGVIKLSKMNANVIIEGLDYVAIANSDEVFISKDKDNSWLVKDSSSNNVSDIINGSIVKFNEKYISALNNGRRYLYDYNGNMLLEDGYDYIDFYEDIIICINDKKLFAYDNHLNKLNETEIKLKNEYYNKSYIYDSKNVLKETKEAYKLSYKDGKLEITLSDETVKVININESKINENFGYVKYASGVLYFYSDEEKTDLIGKYTCTNKNEITSASQEYSNCFVAKENDIINSDNKNGYSPIINGSYVFINDTKTGANSNNIILYDIINQNSKAKYHEVDTGVSFDNIESIQLLNTLIYAQNTEGAYGAITFGNNGPSTVIPFRITVSENSINTKSIVKFKNDYLIANRGDKKYLYDKKGTLLATTSFNIIDYYNKYLLVEDTDYILYKMNEDGTNGSIISERFDHIDLYDKYFVAFKNNKLNVYRYTDPKVELITSGIELLSQDKNYKNYQIEFGINENIITLKGTDNKILKFDNKWSPIDEEE